jgi:hypothetical protein
MKKIPSDASLGSVARAHVSGMNASVSSAHFVRASSRKKSMLCLMAGATAETWLPSIRIVGSSYISCRKLLGYPCSEVTESVSAVRFGQTRYLHGVFMVGNVNRSSVMSLP